MQTATIFVTRDPEGHGHVLASLEGVPDGALGREGARARRQLLPGLEHLAADDFRGRRIDLGTLLKPDPAPDPARSAADVLGDLGAHLVELPEFGAPGRTEAHRIPLRVRYFGTEPPELEALVPAPGGGSFALDLAPVALPRGARGGLLCTATEVGGPWLVRTGERDPDAAATFALLREAGIAGLRGGPDSFLAEWLARDAENGGASLRGPELERARTALGGALGDLLGQPHAELEAPVGDFQLRRAPGSEGWSWSIQLASGETPNALQFTTARISETALARLLRSGRTPLVPWWLLLFDRNANGEPSLAEVLDARAYLARHPELWSRPIDAEASPGEEQGPHLPFPEPGLPLPGRPLPGESP